MSNTAVDWEHWLRMPTVTLWDAVVLSMDVAPEDENWILTLVDGKVVNEEGRKFKRRLDLLTSHFFDNDNLKISYTSANNSKSKIYLDSFVEWALNTAHWDIPKELGILVVAENLPKETEREEIHTLFDPEKKGVVILLFDRVKPEEWKKHFNQAARNELSNAREGIGLYNLAKVGDWLVKRGIYTRQHLDGKLANNLPPRSKDKKHLITGDID